MSATVTIQQPYPTVTCSGSVNIDGGDTGAAEATLTLDRTRFLAFATGVGTGLYALPVRQNGMVVTIGGVDFSSTLDGPVEVRRTLENYIEVRTARFSLRDPRLAYRNANSISVQEEPVTIDFQSGPFGLVETWRAFSGFVQPSPNDEPWNPAGQFNARSWLADILSAQVCVNLPAFSRVCRRDILVAAALSAGYDLTINGPTGAIPRKAVPRSGVTFQQMLTRYCEIEGWYAIESDTPGTLILLPESYWLGAAIDPDNSLCNFSENDGLSYLEMKETPPGSPVTSWTISGSAIGPGQSSWGNGSLTQDGTYTTVTWGYGFHGTPTYLPTLDLSARFTQTVTTTTYAFGAIIGRITTQQFFDSVASQEPFWYTTTSGVYAQPTRRVGIYLKTEGQDQTGAFGLLSEVATLIVYPGPAVPGGSPFDPCIPKYQTVYTYGYDDAAIYGLLETAVTVWDVNPLTVALGYALTTYTLVAAEGDVQAATITFGDGTYIVIGFNLKKRESWAGDGNDGWSHSTATIRYYGDPPHVEASTETGTGDLPLPPSAAETEPVTEEQPFQHTVTMTDLNFPPIEKNEYIADLEDAAEAHAVAIRRMRLEYGVAYARQGRILPNETIGDPEAISDYVRNMTDVGGYVMALTQTITPAGQGQSGDNLCERGIMVPPAGLVTI
ncbi:hypothetical protein EPO05_06445 [Patescibacteria group bacterium]|nr:MAG: hypothetical protein EPO05_06445 [Patescibacteria group bacterium]